MDTSTPWVRPLLVGGSALAAALCASWVTVIIRQPRMIASIAAGTNPIVSVFLGLVPELVFTGTLFVWSLFSLCRKTDRHCWERKENIGASGALLAGMFGLGFYLVSQYTNQYSGREIITLSSTVISRRAQSRIVSLWAFATTTSSATY